MTPAKCWMDKDGEGAPTAPSGVGMRSIVCHVGSEDGFVNGAGLVYRGKHALQGSDYHSEMNLSIFLDWLEKRVFPAIPPRSVLVIDRATYHTVLTEETKPAKATFTKAELVEWLVKKGVASDIDGHTVSTPDGYVALKKVELEAVCKQHKPAPVLQAQVLARKFDCDVLLLPVAHPELNPIEMVWASVKGYAAKRNVNYSLTDAERLTIERLGQIGADEWSKYVRHCIKVDNNYYNAADDIPFECTEN
uniref:Tc1-like transposase DDE domain-containing protein n=1 Tax=Globisporangium ultimum (strain ATCC 200006 / CBS 805.95 / DAOM BR144) TaxID=431595 RepID=K3WS06_GLOUD